jgi:hypothetical protein
MRLTKTQARALGDLDALKGDPAKLASDFADYSVFCAYADRFKVMAAHREQVKRPLAAAVTGAQLFEQLFPGGKGVPRGVNHL